MPINPQIFRAYDIRGIVGEDLSPEIIHTLSRAYGTWLSRRRIVDAVVGADSRPTSPEYKKAAILGLTESGINVLDIGTVLSTMTYWAQYWFNANGALMVTASHNPVNYNGLKLSAGYSQGLIGAELQELKKIIDNNSFVSGQGTSETKDIKDHYFQDLLKRIKVSRKLKILIDTDNGTPGLFAQELFSRAGFEVLMRNEEIKSDMPLGTADPTDEKYMQRLSSETIDSQADLGLAFDTDGDRIGMVDEKGNAIWDDVLLSLLAKDILERIPGSKIVFNTLCSRLVKETIESSGGTPVMCRTGHSYVEEKMNKERAPLGGELSGHFFFGDNFYGFDDAFFSALRFLDYFSRQNLSLSELVAALPSYHSSPEIKLACTEDTKVSIVDDLSIQLRTRFPRAEFNLTDGIRLDFSDAMIVARASDNGPYITLRFEGKTPERYQQMKSVLQEFLHLDKRLTGENGVNSASLAFT